MPFSRSCRPRHADHCRHADTRFLTPVIRCDAQRHGAPQAAGAIKLRTFMIVVMLRKGCGVKSSLRAALSTTISCSNPGGAEPPRPARPSVTPRRRTDRTIGSPPIKEESGNVAGRLPVCCNAGSSSKVFVRKPDPNRFSVFVDFPKLEAVTVHNRYACAYENNGHESTAETPLKPMTMSLPNWAPATNIWLGDALEISLVNGS